MALASIVSFDRVSDTVGVIPGPTRARSNEFTNVNLTETHCLQKNITTMDVLNDKIAEEYMSFYESAMRSLKDDYLVHHTLTETKDDHDHHHHHHHHSGNLFTLSPKIVYGTVAVLPIPTYGRNSLSEITKDEFTCYECLVIDYTIDLEIENLNRSRRFLKDRARTEIAKMAKKFPSLVPTRIGGGGGNKTRGSDRPYKKPRITPPFSDDDRNDATYEPSAAEETMHVESDSMVVAHPLEYTIFPESEVPGRVVSLPEELVHHVYEAGLAVFPFVQTKLPHYSSGYGAKWKSGLCVLWSIKDLMAFSTTCKGAMKYAYIHWWKPVISNIVNRHLNTLLLCSIGWSKGILDARQFLKDIKKANDATTTTTRGPPVIKLGDLDYYACDTAYLETLLSTYFRTFSDVHPELRCLSRGGSQNEEKFILAANGPDLTELDARIRKAIDPQTREILGDVFGQTDLSVANFEPQLANKLRYIHSRYLPERIIVEEGKDVADAYMLINSGINSEFFKTDTHCDGQTPGGRRTFSTYNAHIRDCQHRRERETEIRNSDDLLDTEDPGILFCRACRSFSKFCSDPEGHNGTLLKGVKKLPFFYTGDDLWKTSMWTSLHIPYNRKDKGAWPAWRTYWKDSQRRGIAYNTVLVKTVDLHKHEDYPQLIATGDDYL